MDALLYFEVGVISSLFTFHAGAPTRRSLWGQPRKQIRVRSSERGPRVRVSEPFGSFRSRDNTHAVSPTTTSERARARPLHAMASPSTADTIASVTESADPDALVALSVAQALPTDIEQERPTIQTSAAARVDSLVQGEMEEEVERGPATTWLKENQLMLTYFVAGTFFSASSHSSERRSDEMS